MNTGSTYKHPGTSNEGLAEVVCDNLSNFSTILIHCTCLQKCSCAISDNKVRLNIGEDTCLHNSVLMLHNLPQKTEPSCTCYCVSFDVVDQVDIAENDDSYICTSCRFVTGLRRECCKAVLKRAIMQTTRLRLRLRFIWHGDRTFFSWNWRTHRSHFQSHIMSRTQNPISWELVNAINYLWLHDTHTKQPLYNFARPCCCTKHSKTGKEHRH